MSTTNNKVDTVQSSLGTMESNLNTKINLIPTNPLLTTDARVNNLNYLDTTSSQLPGLTSTNVWSYPSRTLSGASGITQLDVNGFNGGFLVGQNVYLNITLKDTSNNLISGRIYPTNLAISLYKGGILTSTTGNITVTETETANYRIVINASLIDTPAIDYLVSISDTSNVALPQRIEFNAFEVAGVSGPRSVKIYAIDSFTTLPIPDTQVYIKNSSQTLIVNKGITSVDGSYSTSLGDGNYNVFLKKSFVDFTTPQSLVVSADTTTSYYGTSFSPSLPTSPDTCMLYGWISGIDGKNIKGAKVVASDAFNSSYAGSYKIGKTSKSTVTDSNGFWEVELVRNSILTPVGIKYRITMSYPGFDYFKVFFDIE